jgi:hypothetical protein
MSKLSDVQLSMQGEQKTETLSKNELSSLYSESQAAKPERQFYIFKLAKKKRGRTYVDGINDAVMNPNSKKRERIWLLNGADSIWQSDLVELLKDKDYIRRNRRSLLFEDGICRIPVHDDRAIEFARACNHNIGIENRTKGGKYDFYEYDAAKEQQAGLKKQMLKIDMVIKAKEMKEDKMKKLASFLGIIFYDDLGQPKGEDGIRSELMLRADSDPIGFQKYIDSEEVEVAYLVKKAIIEAKIDLGGQPGNAVWAGGKGLIAKIPAARKPHEYLTELAMTNSEDGRRFKEQLQTFTT